MGGWQHNNSTKARQAGHANEQDMYSLMSMVNQALKFLTEEIVLVMFVGFQCLTQCRDKG